MFTDYLKAGYPCLWVQTHEEDRAITALSQTEDYEVYQWDIVTGLQNLKTRIAQPMADPVAPLKAIPTLPETCILFLKDFHKFIASVEVFRTLKTVIPTMKSSGRHIVFVSPTVNIPIELEKDITIYPFSLPTVKDLVDLAGKIVRDNELDVPIDEATISIGQGLTLAEAENTFALSIIQKKCFSKQVIENEKLQAIRKSGLMEFYPAVPESELGGVLSLKSYIHNRKKGFLNKDLPTPKGILMVGPPGSGKSLAAKVTASVLDFPLIRLDIASLKGSLVGESERKMRQALDLIDAVSPAVILLDEIEKALGGVQSSNKTDGGTTSAMFGHLLTWMQESTKPKFLVATCNSMEDLLSISQGALLRRFDDIFYVDLPSDPERRDILKIMNDRYKTSIPQKLTERMDGWTGAEIEKFVKASVYDGTEEALVNIRPISIQNKDVIDKARKWAESNARFANATRVESAKKGRRLSV